MESKPTPTAKTSTPQPSTPIPDDRTPNSSSKGQCSSPHPRRTDRRRTDRAATPIPPHKPRHDPQPQHIDFPHLPSQPQSPHHSANTAPATAQHPAGSQQKSQRKAEQS